MGEREIEMENKGKEVKAGRPKAEGEVVHSPSLAKHLAGLED